MNRPRRLLALAAVLAMLSSAACIRDESGAAGRGSSGGGGADDGLPACPVDALDDAEGPVEIDLWHALAAESELALEQIADDYNASQDKVEVVVRNQGTAYEEVLRKYVAAIPSGQLPAIAYLEDTTLRQVADSGTVLPAEACEQADDFYTGQLPVVRNYYSVDGTYYPGYTNVSSQVLYYNATQVASAGLDVNAPPGDLAGVREWAEALQADGVPQPLALIMNAWFVESWIIGAGETVVNKDNGRAGLADESTFDNPATRELYTWIKEMDEAGLLEGYSATDAQIDHYLAIAQRNSTMGPETSTAATTIKAVLGGETYDEGEGIDVGTIDAGTIQVRAGLFPGLEEPGQVRVAGGAFFMSNTGTDVEQAAAWDFMKYMWSTDAQVLWHLRGSYLPTTQAAANDPAVIEYQENDLAGQILNVAYDQLTGIDPDNPGPQIGPYVDYSDAIKNSLDQLVLQDASVDAVIQAADEAIQEALTTYIEDNAE